MTFREQLADMTDDEINGQISSTHEHLSTLLKDDISSEGDSEINFENAQLIDLYAEKGSRR
jgi:hypothetical protein